MIDATITIPQGCDYKVLFTMYETGTSTPFDLTGYTARFRVSKKDLSENYIDIEGNINNVSGTPGGTTLINNPIDGRIVVAVNPHNAQDLPTNNICGEEALTVANNVYSLVVSNGTKVIKVIQGPCAVEPGL